jgi:hypothetical protein
MITQRFCRRWVALAALAVGLCQADAREWTSVSGAKVEAEFVRLTGDSVTLRKPDGETLVIRMNLLSAADQAHVAELAKPEVQTINLPGAVTRSAGNTGMVLSKAEVDALQTTWTDPKNDDQFSFYARFSVNPNSPKNKNWKEGRPIEFRITADCTRSRNNKRQRENTTCYMYLLDENDRPVVTRSQSVDSMCPT